MALKTDYVDAVFSGNRKYQMVTNSDGTYSFIDVTDYEVNGSYFGAEDINETNETINSLDLGLSDGSVTKVGTSTVGSSTKPIYLSSGTPTAISGTVGGAARPVYLSSGTVTACSSTVGSGTVPVYMSSGTVTASTSTVGSGTKPVYLSSGTITASSSTVGSGTVPIYLSSGTVTASSTTVGGAARPMWLSSGTMTACSSTVGSTTLPVYMNGGTLTACGSNLDFSYTTGSGTASSYISNNSSYTPSLRYYKLGRFCYINAEFHTASSFSSSAVVIATGFPAAAATTKSLAYVNDGKPRGLAINTSGNLVTDYAEAFESGQNVRFGVFYITAS